MYLKHFPLAETARQLRQGERELVPYIHAVCDHIEATEPQILALLPEPDWRARLLTDAHVLQACYPNPENRPPLYGVLVGVKDIFRVDGFPTKAGSRLPETLFAGPEAVAVTQLKQAGALVLGKTVTTEFAYFYPGPTRNPHNLEHTPGGSSSGSAAAVAAGFCQLALGTQTIGSIIRPASFCGVVGFKPSYNRIATDGVLPISQALDHVGFLTQDVAGARLAASVLCQQWNSQAKIPHPQAILGIPEGKYLKQADPQILTVFTNIVNTLAQAGFTIKRISAFENIETINRQHRRIMAAEMALVHAEWFAKYRELYSPQSTDMIVTGQTVRQQEVDDAKAGQIALRADLQEMQQRHGFDLWMSPAAPTEAPKGLQSTGNPIMNFPWTYAGLPSLSLPVAVSPNGLPVGLQLTAAFGADELLLQWAEEIQRPFLRNN